MFNQTILMGRICNELELKNTPNGVPVLSFRLAVERKFQSDRENKVADFFTVVAWRNTAEFVSKWFSKGRMIQVVGELQNRKYTDQKGIEKQITEVVADSVNFTGERKSEDHTNSYGGAERYNQPSATPQTESANAQVAQPQTTATDDDYPF